MDPLIKKTEKTIQEEIAKAKEGEVTIPEEEKEEEKVSKEETAKKKGKKAKKTKKPKKKGKSGDVLEYDIPLYRVGDEVKVFFKIVEGDKERHQIFQGTVIAKKHGGIRETFTVRRIVEGEGVERIFPLHSPKISRIEVLRRGRVKRAKLYYLRDRVGKARKVKELLGEPVKKVKKREAERLEEKEANYNAKIEELIAAKKAKDKADDAKANAAKSEEVKAEDEKPSE
ncbi:MAG: 50S ribosomal protein L19 [Planctomycetes bacterium]|nr:50S ribosomal protein L19 [Planctomycetota bacterium]